MFIIGNVKIDETRPERVHYFFATLLSYKPFSKQGIGITLNNCSEWLYKMTSQLLADNFERYTCSYSCDGVQFWQGIQIHQPLPQGFYWTFEEDHFCMLETNDLLEDMADIFANHNVHLIRASFHKIEQRSAQDIVPKIKHRSFKIFTMNEENHQVFSQPYGLRYFIGTNNVIRTEFAKKLYSRPGTRPHEFELSDFNQEFQYNCAIPNMEIMRSIDDDHGEPGTSLKSKPTEKFLRCMEESKKYIQ